MKNNIDKPREDLGRVAVAVPWSGMAHGNAFRVTYQNGHWDDVEAWTSRRLDARNETKYVYVYC